MVGEVEDLLGQGLATAARMAARPSPVVGAEAEETLQVPSEEAATMEGRPEADPARPDAGVTTGGLVARRLTGRPIMEVVEVGRRLRPIHPRAKDGRHVLAIPTDAIPAYLAEVDPTATTRKATSVVH